MTGILRVRAVLSGWTGGPALNTFYFKGVGTSPNQAECNDVVARVRSFWNSAAVYLPSAVTVNVDPTADVITAETGGLENSLSAAAPPTPVAGTGATEFYAPSVAALLRLNTSVIIAGRRLKGRSFISPLTEGAVASGTVAVATITGLVGAATALTAVTPTLSTLVIWRRPVNGAGGATAPVTSITVPSKVATLRSRNDS